MCKEYCGVELNFCHYTSSNDRGTLLYEVAKKQSPMPSVLVASGEEPNPGSPCNDEFWDGTDAACPAWWRGAEDSIVVLVRGIHKTLDALQCGEEPPRNFGSSEINGLVERIETLYKSMKV